MQLKHVLCDIQPHDLQAIHGADDLSSVHSCITIHDGSSVVFVEAVVYHALGTLIPYPSEDPPQSLGNSFLINGCFVSVRKLCSFKVGGIHSIFDLVVQTLDNATGELLFGPKVVENKFMVIAQRLGNLLHRLNA